MESIEVVVLLESGKRVKARLSTFPNVRTLTVGLVRKLGLPLVAEGKTLLYSLWHNQRQRGLSGYENLLAAHVEPGDTLELTAALKERVGQTGRHFDASGATPGDAHVQILG